MNEHNSTPDHKFHIPVLGLGYSIDTPVKVARFGISSVVSIVDDYLIEGMREIYQKKLNQEYEPISEKSEDFRARRITSYLNILDAIVTKQVDELKKQSFESSPDLLKYFSLLPENSPTKKMFNTMLSSEGSEKGLLQKKLKDSIRPGSIDVNIMTKLDKQNYDSNGENLGAEYTDALAALRGYALSNLTSSIVFSAGLNPRLFSYCEKFADFFPDENQFIKKRIILKVSDYRSALIQGKFLAKKGLWISEFRIESGLNCGGHAFPTEGLLLGPILEEFKTKRDELYNELLNATNASLQISGKRILVNPEMNVTVQGGVGTNEENDFLLSNYQLRSIGWGSPFLLVPEATNVDSETLGSLSTAKQEDYYLSNASPLGILFNNFRKSSSEKQRIDRLAKGRPGSPCYKKYLVTNTEFTEKPICTASRQYQDLKLKSLTDKKEMTDQEKKEYQLTIEKDCICEGLAVTAFTVNDAPAPHKLSAVTICPGPNLAFFSGVFSLKEMVDHIYGRRNLLNTEERPHVFINELKMYVAYLKKEIDKQLGEISAKNKSYYENFKQNLLHGVDYYKGISKNIFANNKRAGETFMEHLNRLELELSNLQLVKAVLS